MSFVRYFKGKTLSWAYQLVPARPLVCSRERRDAMERESRRMQLYFSHVCPSSLAAQRYCQRLGLRVVEKNVARVLSYRNELLNEGGQSRVPCLRIEEDGEIKWLYSCDSIRSYLEQRF